MNVQMDKTARPSNINYQGGNMIDTLFKVVMMIAIAMVAAAIFYELVIK